MYSNYCRHSLLCTKYFVCACYELLMSINIVQCSTQTEKKRPTDSSQEFTKFLRFLQIGIQTYTACNILLSGKDLTLIFRRDPTGVCHMVLITFHYPRDE